MSNGEKFWAVVPAAGVGQRMGAGLPKQYLQLHGRLVIEHSIGRLLEHPQILGVCVALAHADGWWDQTAFAEHPAVLRVTGGQERAHSVLNALEVLARRLADNAWVLVHDAARPCVRGEDITRLIQRAAADPVGGVLAVPVRDTIKRSGSDGRIAVTLPREDLWQVYTPQMFRLGQLRAALDAALHSGHTVTDDASAMELTGQAPLLVEGHADNIKITRPEDLSLAEFFLGQRDHRCV